MDADIMAAASASPPAGRSRASTGASAPGTPISRATAATVCGWSPEMIFSSTDDLQLDALGLEERDGVLGVRPELFGHDHQRRRVELVRQPF